MSANILRPIGAAATLAAIATVWATTGAPASAASVAPPATAVVTNTTHTVHPNWCSAQYWITADGVRIHSAPNLRATVVGLAYSGWQVSEDATVPGWDHIITNGGVRGWVAAQFVAADEWCD